MLAFFKRFPLIFARILHMHFLHTNRHPAAPVLVAAVLGFVVSFILFLVLTLTMPLFGELLLGKVIILEGPGKEALQESMGFAAATAALVSFWWWTAVIGVAFLFSFSFLTVFRK